jgi:hypothetical protein
MHRAVIVLALSVLGGAALALGPSIAPFSRAAPGDALPAGWAPLTFRSIDRATRYTIVVDDGGAVVEAVADGSASGLTHRLDVDVQDAGWLRWTWKALRLPERGDTRAKHTDDAAARVYVMFRASPDRLPWPQRLRHEAAQRLYGEAPPHASLMYVWDTRAPVGASFVNPWTDRVRTIVVESGSGKLGQWVAYERDLLADYRAAFAEEPPPVSGVAIMTDADNTRGSATARYRDVALSAR